MNDWIGNVGWFMVSGGQTIVNENRPQADFYETQIKEEFDEFTEKENTEANKLKELLDLIWVSIAYGISMGYDLDGAFEELTRSNMSKVDPSTGTIVKRADGKILKPASYSPADMQPFLN